MLELIVSCKVRFLDNVILSQLAMPLEGMNAMSQLERVFKKIDENEDRDVKAAQEYFRQPSVSSTGEGIREAASLTMDILKDLGAKGVRTISFKDGHPVVFGKLFSKNAKRTMVFYDMYDVQPVEPLDAWLKGPWSAEIVEGKIIARGAVNTKGPLISFLNAVRSIQEVDSLPVNLIFIIEGEEELGSPHLPEALETVREDLEKAHSAYMQVATQSPVTRYKPVVWLGAKGGFALEFEVASEGREVHSMWSNIIDNPVWRLIWALDSIRDSSDEVRVRGFYDDVIPPSKDDLELMKRLMTVVDERSIKEAFGLKRIRKGMRGMEMLKDLFFMPNPVNISGISAGYTGPGVRGAVPAHVRAKAEIRLVPNMKPEKVVRSIREHLKRQGFDDVKVRPVMGYPAAKTEPKAPIAQACLRALERVNHEPLAFPLVPGGAPVYLFNTKFNLPMALAGFGYVDQAHVPNEFMTVEQLILSEKLAAAVLYEYASVRSR